MPAPHQAASSYDDQPPPDNPRTPARATPTTTEPGPGPKRRPRWLVVAALALPWTPALIAWWPSRPYIPDLISHFAPQLGVLLALAAIAAAARAALGRRECLRRRAVGSLNLLAAGAAAWSLYAAACHAPRPVPDADPGLRLRVAVYNAKDSIRPEPGADAFTAWLEQQDADLVAVIEGPLHFPLSQPWVMQRYPYRVVPEAGLMWPLMLLSRFPIEITPFVERTPEWVGSFLAHRSVIVTVPGRADKAPIRFLFTASHPPSPRKLWTWRASLRRAQMEGGLLRAFRNDRGMPVILAGDFNSTPVGEVFRAYQHHSGLIGWQAPGWPLEGRGTWHALLHPALAIPIDRVWTTDDVAVTRIRVGPRFGSDHRPIIADLVIRPDPP